ncbi:MAG TPA: mycothiol system anti-sigma-R factor [Actinocrinis sp.]|jgi:anti-sigma factor (TIGR02949 family)
MSCGNPHETDCSLVLDRLYEYIDREMADDDCSTIREHLDECSPCLAEYGLEQAVKALVQRSCGCDTAPEQLRSKILQKIRAVQDNLAAEAEPAQSGR